MTTFTIIAILLFLVVLAIGLLSDEEFTCLSDAYYTMKTCFFPAMALMAVCTLMPALSITPESFEFLAFLMCGMIGFVGVAGDYRKSGVTRVVHLASAGLSAVCSVAWTAAVYAPALWCGVLCVVSLADRRRWLLWLELACFGMVFCGLMFKG